MRAAHWLSLTLPLFISVLYNQIIFYMADAHILGKLTRTAGRVRALCSPYVPRLWAMRVSAYCSVIVYTFVCTNGLVFKRMLYLWRRNFINHNAPIVSVSTHNSVLFNQQTGPEQENRRKITVCAFSAFDCNSCFCSLILLRPGTKKFLRHTMRAK